MSPRYWIRLLTIVVGVQTSVQAQDVAFERVSGLPDPRVSDIVQDETGFLWIASGGGLIRYDGYEFTRYGPVAGDPHSLSGNRVRRLLLDRDGTLWVATWFEGLNHFDPASETFTRYRHDPADPSTLSDDEIREITLDSRGTLWVGTGDGLNRFDRRTGHFTRIRNDPDDARSLSHNRVERILESRDGTFWIATYGGGLNHMTPEEAGSPPAFTHYRHDPGNPGSLSHDAILDLHEDRSGALWIATWGGGLDRLDPGTGRLRHHRHHPRDPTTLPDDHVLKVYEDRTGVLWIVTPTYISNLDEGKGKFVHHHHDPDDARSVPPSILGALYEDAAGSVWVGSFGGGLGVWHRGKRLFAHHRHEAENPNSVLGNVVATLYTDRAGQVWIGSTGGLSRLDPQTWAFTHYRHDPADPGGLSNDIVTSVLEGRDGTLWVGTVVGLNRLRRGSRAFTRYLHDPRDPSSLSESAVNALSEDHDGTIWVATSGGGINKLDPATGRSTRLGHDAGDKVYSLFRDREGRIWAGSETGLHRFDPDGRSHHYAHEPSDPESIGPGVVHSIFQDRRGRLWVGADGLNRFLPGQGDEGHRFVRASTAEGLVSAGVRATLEDDEGHLWVSTARAGLFRFDPLTGSFDQFDVSDGLHGQTAFSYGATRNRDGRMYFGGDNGFVVFHPEDIRLNPDVPPVVVTDFRIGHEPVPIGEDSVLTRSIVETREITLSPEDRVISFEFAALDYRAPQRHRYRYTLEGFEATWTETDATRRTATYTNLDPGEYTFRVTGSNNHGVWNEEGAAIRITVNPAWWQTWWFRVLAVGVMAGLLVVAYKLRVKYVLQTNRRLEEEIEERKTTEAALIRSEEQLRDMAGRIVAAQEDERRRVARELHDDVTQRLALLAINAGALVRRPPDTPELMAEQLRDLKQMLAAVSEQVRTVSHQLHPSELEHLGLIQTLRVFCEELSESGVEVQLTVADPDLPIPWETAIGLYRVAQESLRNAVKHSEAKTIRVSLSRSNDHACLSVADDGRGFDPATASLRRGLGLTSMEERVRHLGGELRIRSEPGRGTEITAHVPLSDGRSGKSETS